jgi:hypothetical protein
VNVEEKVDGRHESRGIKSVEKGLKYDAEEVTRELIARRHPAGGWKVLETGDGVKASSSTRGEWGDAFVSFCLYGHC